MASVRKMALPSGWYPHSAANVAAALEGFSLNRSTAVRAVIAPHAGWFFLAGLLRWQFPLWSRAQIRLW